MCVSVAFLFNWIGLLASLWLSQTIAGRMGALAGFGLSIIKWVAIFKVFLLTAQYKYNNTIEPCAVEQDDCCEVYQVK